MAVRTKSSTVLFREPFVLAGFDEELAAGAYKIETDEELLDTVLSISWRRVRTVIQLHPDITYPGRVRSLTVDPLELDAALARDRGRPENLPNAVARRDRDKHESKADEVGNSR